MEYYETKHNFLDYDTDTLLIQHNPETGVYRIRNTIAKGNKTITKEEFELQEPIKIKHQKFCEKVNEFFRHINHGWEYENTYFRKLDNFDKDGKSSGFSYWDLPKHSQGRDYLDTLGLVYHWGRVYYFLYGGNYCPRGQLLDVNTLNVLQWVHIRNVAPIFNTETKTLA